MNYIIIQTVLANPETQYSDLGHFPAQTQAQAS